MELEWDENKNQINYEKHGLSFKDAELVFLGDTVTFHDDRHNYGEERFITLGALCHRIVIIVHTQRNFVTRIISMRKANEREKKIYFKQLEKNRQNER